MDSIYIIVVVVDVDIEKYHKVYSKIIYILKFGNLNISPIDYIIIIIKYRF